MADEITIDATLSYSDSEKTSDALQLVDGDFSATTKLIAHLKQSIATSETAIKLGAVSALGYAMFKNLDPTNYIDLKVATSGAIFARLDPDVDGDGHGGIALLKMGSGAQVPYAIANTAACQMEVLIIST